MSHREQSLQPWITNEPDSRLTKEDLERAVNALVDWDDKSRPWSPSNPVYLPKSLYDRAAALGYDMSLYAVTQPMPLRPVPDSMTRRGNPVRKSVRNGSACHGKDVPCMPGHGGKCTACYNDD